MPCMRINKTEYATLKVRSLHVETMKSVFGRRMELEIPVCCEIGKQFKDAGQRLPSTIHFETCISLSPMRRRKSITHKFKIE